MAKHILYIDTIFDANWDIASPARKRKMKDKLETATTRLRNTRFNVLVFSSLEVEIEYGELRLSFNDTAFDELYEDLDEIFDELKAGGKTLLFSVGYWTGSHVFEAISKVGVEAFCKAFYEQVAKPLGIDGLDIDLEAGKEGETWESVFNTYGQLIIDLTNHYTQTYGGVVSHVANMNIVDTQYLNAGIEGSKEGILAATKGTHKNNISWISVNLPAQNQPDQVLKFFGDKVMKPLEKVGFKLKINRPKDMIVPGFAAYTPDYLEPGQQLISKAAAKFKTKGYFVWKSSLLSNDECKLKVENRWLELIWGR